MRGLSESGLTDGLSLGGLSESGLRQQVAFNEVVWDNTWSFMWWSFGNCGLRQGMVFHQRIHSDTQVSKLKGVWLLNVRMCHGKRCCGVLIVHQDWVIIHSKNTARQSHAACPAVCWSLPPQLGGKEGRDCVQLFTWLGWSWQGSPGRSCRASFPASQRGWCQTSSACWPGPGTSGTSFSCRTTQVHAEQATTLSANNSTTFYFYEAADFRCERNCWVTWILGGGGGGGGGRKRDRLTDRERE